MGGFLRIDNMTNFHRYFLSSLNSLLFASKYMLLSVFICCILFSYIVYYSLFILCISSYPVGDKDDPEKTMVAIH